MDQAALTNVDPALVTPYVIKKLACANAFQDIMILDAGKVS